MEELAGATAVVTGAASGIGRGLCEELADARVHVVAADVEASALEATVSELRDRGGSITAIPTDVTDATAVDELARHAFAEHTDVRFVFANAGVFAGGLLWESTDTDWDWTLGVNLRGIVHTIRAFVPTLLARDHDSQFVITASLAGLITAPLSGIYATSKFAAVALAESLHHDLSLQPGARVRVACVVPGPVNTRIAASERNRASAPIATDATAFVTQALADTTAAGIEPRTAAKRILAGLSAGDFYLPTNDAFARLVEIHNATRLARRPPELLMYD